MASIEFDTTLQEELSELIEVVISVLHPEATEIQEVHIFGSMESKMYYFNFAFLVNNHWALSNEVNLHTKIQHDFSMMRIYPILKSGTDILKKIEGLFKNDGRESPTMLDIQYSFESKKFDCEFTYGNQYIDTVDKTVSTCFLDWFERKKSKS